MLLNVIFKTYVLQTWLFLFLFLQQWRTNNFSCVPIHIRRRILNKFTVWILGFFNKLAVVLNKKQYRVLLVYHWAFDDSKECDALDEGPLTRHGHSSAVERQTAVTTSISSDRYSYSPVHGGADQAWVSVIMDWDIIWLPALYIISVFD